jgi:anaerobic selenocysteine-containing dehydrogenase
MYAERMGFRDRDGTPLPSWRTPDQAFEAWREATRGRPVDYTGLSYEQLRGGSGIPWPVNSEHPSGAERLYSDGVFPTDTDSCETYGHDLLTGGAVTELEHRAIAPAGRAFLKAADYVPPYEEPSKEYPMVFTTGRNVYQFHTRTKTGRSPRLHRAAPDAWVEISQEDADLLDIRDGQMVRVESPRGAIEAAARIGPVSPGVVFAPFHYGPWDPASGPDLTKAYRQANELTMTVWDPVSKQPYFKTAACRITEPHTQNGKD